MLKMTHAAILLHADCITHKDIRDNFLQHITHSLAYKFSPLDIYRLRTELFIFVSRLSKLYNTRIKSGDHDRPLRNIQFNTNSDCITSHQSLPPELDHVLLSGTLEKGDLIDYTLQISIGTGTEQDLVRRATVTGIRLELDETTKTVLLNNGDRIVGSLHKVRRVSMRNLYTEEAMWNPIRVWKSLSDMHLHPTEFASQENCNVPSPAANNEAEMDIAPEMVTPDDIEPHAGKAHYRRRQQRQKNRRYEESIRKPRTKINCIALQRMKPEESIKEISSLNALHRTCLQMGQIPSFNELMKTKTTWDYYETKTNIVRELKKKQTRKFFPCAFIYHCCSFQLFRMDSILQ